MENIVKHVYFQIEHPATTCAICGEHWTGLAQEEIAGVNPVSSGQAYLTLSGYRVEVSRFFLFVCIPVQQQDRTTEEVYAQKKVEGADEEETMLKEIGAGKDIMSVLSESKPQYRTHDQHSNLGVDRS